MACVCIALTRHAPLKWRIEKSRQKPTKIQFEPEIVAVRDGLYCRVNFTVRAEAAPAVLKWSGQEVGGAMSSDGCGWVWL